MIAHSIDIRVFSKEEENSNIIKTALIDLLKIDLKKEKIKINETDALNLEKNPIKIFEINLKKKKNIENFLFFLNEKITNKSRNILLKQLDSRLDNKCNFFLRFDKQKWIKEKKLEITEKGNCFHLKINIAAFPNKKNNAIKIIRNLFKAKE